MRRTRRTPEELAPAWRGFLAALEPVERAKAALVEAVPTARAPGLPLAEALVAFEEDLAEAGGRMARWRDERVAQEWEACSAGLDEALAGAARLRSEGPALGYEALLGILGELIGPLDAFEAAAERFRSLGVRPGRRRLRWREPHGAC